MLKYIYIVGFLLSFSSCRSVNGNGAGTKSDLSSVSVFIHCSQTASECNFSCADRNCWGEYKPEFCEAKNPGEGDYACFSESTDGDDPAGPPGSLSDWVDMACDRSPGECRSLCDGQLFVQHNPEKCTDGRLPYDCYCKK